jgi:acetoacetyl-CoA synthetase
MTAPLWTPSTARVGASRMDSFRRRVEAATGMSIANTAALHAWSVSEPGAFWDLTWDDTGVIGDKGAMPFEPGAAMWEGRFFPEASLNFAENLLDGRGAPDYEPAIIYKREDGAARSLSWAELRSQAGAFAAGLQAVGVVAGDRVAAWMPNTPETIIAMLGAATIGAVFTSTSADFGVSGVVDRFGQVAPKALVATDGYVYGGSAFPRLAQLRQIVESLPSLETVVVVPGLATNPDLDGIPLSVAYDAFVSVGTRFDGFQRFPFDHPIYILYSSGTTGQPKCIVHRAGGVLIKHLQEQQHHCDLRAADRLFYFTTCGWMMWNWLASGLATAATVVLFDGNPLYPGPEALFDLAAELDIALFGVSAKYIDSVAKTGLRPSTTHRLESLRTITSTGSPLSEEGFRFVYDSIKPDVHLASISGGTDLCGSFVGGDPTAPVHAGEIQGRALGMAVSVLDTNGRAVIGIPGELVCTAPFPSMPLRFWGDDGVQRYISTYYAQNPGIWTHGDYAIETENGGFVILGRSDATLNAGGVRIGTAEIYRVVETVPGVAEAVAIGQRWDGDTRIVLFVRLVDGAELTPEIISVIRRRLKEEESPRHVPAVILSTPDIPRTRSGKISELAVRAVVNDEPLRNIEALANPEALDFYRDHPGLG